MTTIANSNGHPEIEGEKSELSLAFEPGCNENVSPKGLNGKREVLADPTWNGEAHIPESWREHLARQASQPMIMSAEFERAAKCSQPKVRIWFVASILMAFLLGTLCASALAK